MSWDEWLFKKAYQVFKKDELTETTAQSVQLSTLRRSLEIAFEAITGQSVSILEANEFVGFYADHLFLPKQIELLQSQKLNEELYWLLTCFHAIAVSQFSNIRWNPHLYLSRVTLEFPGLSNCLAALNSFASDQNHHFNFLEFFGQAPVLSHKNDSKNIPHEPSSVDQSSAHHSILQKNGPNVSELKELNENYENPLVHMFEKVQTIETYQGGNKSKQAEESLETLEEALQEIQLKTVIRSTERTPGLIKTDAIVDSSGAVEDPTRYPLKPQQIYYPEWDHGKQIYRKQWCALSVIHPPSEPAQKIRTPTGQELKARLETLFNHFMWQRQQLEGPDLDLQPLIENQVSLLKGGSLSERIYIKRVNQIKDFEVLILMDESLSTESFIENDSILEMMKESVSDLAQAFENSYQQLAVMSFFSETRLNCNIKVLKNFSDTLEEFQSKLKYCKPQGYTRIGVAIRHAIEIMKKSRARRRCVVLLTDAKPTDVDRYEGGYGMADVRKATEELRNAGLELIVLSYVDRKYERLARMFPKQVLLFHATNRATMSKCLLSVVERLVLI